MSTNGTGFENRPMSGFTIKNYIVTIISTVSIVVSVLTTYFNLSEQIKEQRYTQDTQNKVFELRLKLVEAQIEVVKQQIDAMKANQK